MGEKTREARQGASEVLWGHVEEKNGMLGVRVRVRGPAVLVKKRSYSFSVGKASDPIKSICSR